MFEILFPSVCVLDDEAPSSIRVKIPAEGTSGTVNGERAQVQSVVQPIPEILELASRTRFDGAGGAAQVVRVRSTRVVHPPRVPSLSVRENEEEDPDLNMSTWIALFRGINVGGKNVLPMKELKRHLSSLGLQDVQTYIQSGNVVFRCPKRVPATLDDRIATLVEKHHGFRPHVLILGAERLEKAIRANPFPEAEAEPKTLHLFFLAAPPKTPDLQPLSERKSPSESFRLADDVFYLHAPDGIGRSKLAASLEKLLGVPVTARNWRTVQRLREMARGV